jgi:hypothetical protein
MTYGDRDLFAPFVSAINKLLIIKSIQERFVRSIGTGDIAFYLLNQLKL